MPFGTTMKKGGHHRRSSSSATTTNYTTMVGNRREGDGDELESMGSGGLGMGLGLALSTDRGHDETSIGRDEHSLDLSHDHDHGNHDHYHHHQHDQEDDDLDPNLDPDNEGSDHLSFSPETMMSHLVGGMTGRRDLIKERRLGPKTSPSSSSAGGAAGDGARSGWKVFHDTRAGSSGSGDDELVAGHVNTNTTTTFSSTTSSAHPTLSQTLSEYLSLLYTILPLNLVRFLSDPARYLDDHETGIECPFEASGGWRDVWKQGELGRILSVSLGRETGEAGS